MTTRVLAIAGSPRRHGNSERLLDACVVGIEQAGGQADRLYVADELVKPCQGCNACSLTGECVLRDPMTAIYPRIDAADAFVVATPVYFGTVPAVLKALYDRCQPYWARRYVLKEPPPSRRPGVVLVAGGGGDPFGSECAVTTTRSVFGALAVDVIDVVDVTGVDSPSDIGRHPDVLDRARDTGVALVAAAGSAKGVS